MSPKLRAVLSSVMKCHAFLLHSAQDRGHPFVPRVHAVCASCLLASSCLGSQINYHDITVLMFK